jgi:hypothetical protein
MIEDRTEARPEPVHPDPSRSRRARMQKNTTARFALLDYFDDQHRKAAWVHQCTMRG